MAKKEFDNCMLADDKKGAIDKFWIDIAGSNERAKELIKKYKNDLIILSGGLNGEIPNKILNIGENQAEEALLWWIPIPMTVPNGLSSPKYSKYLVPARRNCLFASCSVRVI